jgi:hypothetical protein
MPLDDTTKRVEVEIPHREELALIDGMRALLRTPSNWCKGAESIHGRYCLLGALREAEKGGLNREYVIRGRSFSTKVGVKVWGRLYTLCGGNDPTSVNDAHVTDHRDIVSLLALARASFE